MRQLRCWSRLARNVAPASIFTVLLLGLFTISNRLYTTRQLGQCPYDDDVAGNIVVVVKTGATEASERVEVLMQTSLRCAKHVLFFSDLKQDIEKYHLHDALQTISPSVMREDPVFEFYHRQRELWNTDRNIDPLKGMRDPNAQDALAAWSLDKYKNMHMVEKTWELKPDKDWYVFIDADTYIIWSNLLRWLSSLDPMKRGFFGSKLSLGDTLFMHGGSGMVMSKSTVYNFAVTNNGTAARWDPEIRGECCGDYMLSKALVEYGNDLLNVWPSISGQKPCTFPYSLSADYWCQPTVTMHHLNPSEMKQFADFERQRGIQSIPVTPEEIFESLVKESLLQMPNLDVPRKDWDNMSWKGEIGANLSGGDDETMHKLSVADCASTCEANPSCVQFSHDGESCFIGKATRLGERKKPKDGKRWHSGWHQARIIDWLSKQEGCKAREQFPASLLASW